MKMGLPRVMNTDSGSEFKNVERMKVHYHPQVHPYKELFCLSISLPI